MARSLKRGRKTGRKRRRRRGQKGGFPNFLELNRKFANYLHKKMGTGKRVDKQWNVYQKGRGLWTRSNMLFNPKIAEGFAKGLGLKKG